VKRARCIIAAMRHVLLYTALFLSTAVPAAAQQRGQNPNQQPFDRLRAVPSAVEGQQAAPPGGRESAGAAEEKTSRTPHTIQLDAREVKYTATAGTLPIRGDDGKVQARMFYVAYTKDGEDAKTRPVSFLYNGGPGSATVWLHMGSFAPRHVQ